MAVQDHCLVAFDLLIGHFCLLQGSNPIDKRRVITRPGEKRGLTSFDPPEQFFE
jgi:hypothetical protein